MRNRPFILRVQKPEFNFESMEPENLKNKFSGKTLFRSNIYHLVTGDLTILDTIDNKWFFGELFEYSGTTCDPNVLPALNKIATTGRFDESLKQHASEIAENIEDQGTNNKIRGKSKSLLREDEKAENARKMLAGIRSPQTTEVLRLLREKSPELKRLAIWLIGKFRMTDLSQETCECLGIPDIESDALAVLQTLGEDAVKELKTYYLKSSGNTGICKAIIRFFGKTCPKESQSFLFERLWSTSRQIRELTLKSLLVCGFEANDDEKERLRKLIYDSFGLIAWIIPGKVCLAGHNDQPLLQELNKEYDRWRSFTMDLLALTYGNTIPPVSGKLYEDKKDDIYSHIPKLAEIIFGNQYGPEQKEISAQGNDRKRLKKLQPYFPVIVPGYRDLLEDLINHDYNVISVWTKACAIRSINEIDNENMGESIVALLFSPEGILREESARLISRTGTEFYRISADRIQEPVRKKLDRIISGTADNRELIYDKVCFLSSCFSLIKEDELIFLAERMLFLSNTPLGLSLPQYSSLIWIFRNDKSKPDVIVIQDNDDQSWDRKNMLNACSYCYILPLNSVEEFDFQFSEDSRIIFKYIDDNEG